MHLVMHDFEPGWDTYREAPGYGMESDIAFQDVVVDQYEAVVLIGGRAPEYLSNDARLIGIIREFDRQGKWIFSICHGVQLLAAAGLIDGLQRDLLRARADRGRSGRRALGRGRRRSRRPDRLVADLAGTPGVLPRDLRLPAGTRSRLRDGQRAIRLPVRRRESTSKTPAAVPPSSHCTGSAAAHGSSPAWRAGSSRLPGHLARSSRHRPERHSARADLDGGVGRRHRRRRASPRRRAGRSARPLDGHDHRLARGKRVARLAPGERVRRRPARSPARDQGAARAPRRDGHAPGHPGHGRRGGGREFRRRDPGASARAGRAVRASLRRPGSRNLRALLPHPDLRIRSGLPAHVQVPCLSISGSEDQYAPPDLVTEFVRELPDGGQDVLQDCGHFPFLEQPEAFTAALRPFLERVC